MRHPVGKRWMSALRNKLYHIGGAALYGAEGVGLRLAARLRRPHSARTVRSDKSQVLIVDDLVPNPRYGAGYPRAYAIVRSLVAAGYAIEHYPMEASASECAQMAAEFGHTVRFHLGAGARGLRRLLFKRGEQFDVLFVSRPLPMKALRRARWRGSSRGTAIIYDAEAVVSPRERQQRALFGTPWTTDQYEHSVAAEMQLASGAHAVTAVSRFDARMIGSTLGVPVFVLPHTTSIRTAAPGSNGRKDLLFVGRLTGASHTSPNVDSVSWLVRLVMPKLDQLLGDGYRLHVIGLVHAPEITALASERVVLHGMVDDLEPFYDSCRLFVGPTRYSAGIPLKLIEAMSQAIPCVATSALARQLDAPSDALMTADSPSDFAAACAQLYRDDEKWRSQQAGGLAFVSQFASPEAFDHALAAAINCAVAEARSQASRD